MPAPEPSWKRRLAFWVSVVTGLLAIFAAALAGLGTLWGLTGIGSGEDPAPVRLELKRATPVNRPDIYESGYALPVQTRPTTPKVEVTVRNEGEEPVLIERARVTIEDSARLPICPFFGGAGPGLERQLSYPIELHWLPTRDERVVRHEMQQEVKAGRTGHFALFFRTPPDLGSEHLFAVRAEVVVDSLDEPLPLGRFVLGVPGPVSRTGAHLPENDDDLIDTFRQARETSAEFALTVDWCYRRNLHDMERLLSRPGKRAPTIAALADVQVAPSWSRLADRRPPRAVVEPLLATESLEGQALAVFAAERTGEEALIETTRRRAGATLLRLSGRGGTDQVKPATEILYLRASLSAWPSARAEDALSAAEVRLQAEEEETIDQIR